MNAISHILQHWKTSLSGAAIAGGQVIVNGVHWKQLLLAAAMAALGAIAKDPGSKPN